MSKVRWETVKHSFSAWVGPAAPGGHLLVINRVGRGEWFWDIYARRGYTPLAKGMEGTLGKAKAAAEAAVREMEGGGGRSDEQSEVGKSFVESKDRSVLPERVV